MAKKSDSSNKLTDNYTPLAVRFPQALTLDFTALRNSFGSDYSLITDIIVFLSQGQKADLFNTIRFSLSDFAKKMNYNKDNLRRSEIEFNKKNLPTLRGHVYDGVFEYALFRMLKENVIFEGNYQGKYRAQSFQLIREIEVYNNEKVNSQRKYIVKASNFLLETMFKEFFILNLEDYVLAGKLNKNNRNTVGAGRNLYMALIRGMHLALNQHKKGLEPIFETNVDNLSMACGFDMQRLPQDRKKALKKLLEKFAQLQNLKFEYEFFCKTNSRFPYHIKIKYTTENINAYETELETKFYNLTFAMLENKYKDLYPQFQNAENSFAKWLSNHDYDKPHKVGILKSAYNTIYNTSLDDLSAINYLNEGIDREKWKLL